ncbi:unnamed protein product [Gadus morhua 'NCC']
MAEVIHARPNMMTKSRNTQGEREEGIEDIYDSIESLGDQHQDYVGTEESSNTLGTVRSQQPDPVSPPRCQIRAVVVLLVLLTVALLAGVLRLAVQHKTTGMGRDVEQLLQRLKNVTEQRDSLLCKQDCPRGWDWDFGYKCYLLSKVLGSWNRSRKFCVSNGADLVVVDSKEELDFISRYGGYFWLGATDEASEGLWRWVDGTVLSVDNPSWSRVKPVGGKDKNCLRREFCVSNGADLVVVDDKEELDFTRRYKGNNWLGATDEASEGLWRWVDGTVLTADNPYWSGGKPDGGKDKNCLKRIGEETNFKWTDESCEFTNLGICERNLMK